MISLSFDELLPLVETVTNETRFQEFVNFVQSLQAEGITKVGQLSTDTRKAEQHISELAGNEIAAFITLDGKFSCDQQVSAAIQGGYRLIFTPVATLDKFLGKPMPKNVCVVYLANSEDEIKLLQAIAKLVREKVKPYVFAITGSSGKTSLKEILASILGKKFGETVLATKGNLNNHIGVAQTLLALNSTHKVAVIEHGANHQNEINATTSLSMPDAVAINNVQLAHTVGFGSLENIAAAKSEIYDNQKSTGIRVVNLESVVTEKMLAKPEVTSFVAFDSNGKSSLMPQVPRYLIVDQSVKLTLEGSSFAIKMPILSKADTIEIEQEKTWSNGNSLKVVDNGTALYATLNTNLLGRHQINNIAMAVALIHASGLMNAPEIISSFDTINFPKGRGDIIEVTPFLRVIDDSYNANVGSMQASVNLMDLATDCERAFVVGTFAEVNKTEIELIYRNLLAKVFEQIRAGQKPMSVIGPFVTDVTINQAGLEPKKYTKYFVSLEYNDESIYAPYEIDLTPVLQAYPEQAQHFDIRKIYVASSKMPAQVYQLTSQFYSSRVFKPTLLIFKGSNSSKISEGCKEFIASVRSSFDAITNNNS